MKIEDLQQRLIEMPHGADRRSVARWINCEPEEIIDFSSNIYEAGYTKEIHRAVVHSLEAISFYPDPTAERVQEALSRKVGLPQEMIHLGNGGADLILRLAMALRLSPEFSERQEVLITAPNFSEYNSAFTAVDFKIKHFPLLAEENFQVSERILNEIAKEQMALVLCQPNNPTGITVNAALLAKIRKRCAELRIFLIVDECFLDFLSREKQAELRLVAEAGERLLTVHSFTKLFAIPALRLGYISSGEEEMNQRMLQLTPPWQVSGPAQEAALAALEIKESEIDSWREEIGEEREGLREALVKAGASQISGEANFLFFRHEDVFLQAKLLSGDRPYLIRSCANYPGLTRGYYRIAVKKKEENLGLIAALAKIEGV